ncbi:metal-dependent transcriptional regulator [Falsarthrobacter nasiphocae]|uniref:Manganese transport regulator n=1 Tax=Falsarthrobacter nasiphocae TaxID=189863 RepID=A0AAE4C5X0_9MICC|nr:metal-dependent transcriptional regulator [Falsarthrobacter nasiphocae]MDR6892731.1 DtxR family Mn-dependent transcriptional regulator [Falsarthrobacter nasiphocae]
MTGSPRPTTAEEDYLKAVFALSEWASAPVTSSDLAAELGVANSSVTVMVRKLVQRGWLSHEKYSPILFTPEGYTVALSVVRRHRLLETFLVRQLGYTWEEVHDEADALEHAVSDLFIERLDALLGRPAADPHGDRIPRADGTLENTSAILAAVLDDGHPAVLERVSDANPATLRALSQAGLEPGSRVQVKGSALVSADGGTARGVTGDVWVRALEHESCSLETIPASDADSGDPR